MSHLVGFILCALFSVVLAVQKKTTTLVSVGKCPITVGFKEVEYTISVQGDGDNKSISATAKLKDEITEKFTFKAEVSVYNGETMVPYTDGNGPLCESIDNVAKSAFDRFKERLVPSPTESCKFPPADYKLDKFLIGNDELEMPISTSGKYNVKIHVLNPAGDELVCIEAVLDVKVENAAPSSSSEES